MMRILLICVLFLSGCASTTLKTDSEVTRSQFLLLPEYMAMGMAEDAYRQEINKAEENNKLNEMRRKSNVSKTLPTNLSIRYLCSGMM